MSYSKYIKNSGIETHPKKPYAFPAVSVKVPDVLDWIKEHGAQELETCFPKD